VPSKGVGKRLTVYRSSETGRLVKAGYAKRNPRTTEKERIRRK
jgi:hypothetical protein